MTEISVMDELTHQLDEAIGSNNPARRLYARHLVAHSGLVHEDTEHDGAIVQNENLDGNDAQPAMEAVSMLADLAIAEQLTEGTVSSYWQA